MASRIAVLVLLGVICVGFAAAEIPVDCCLTISEKPMPLQIIVSYNIQDAGNGCEIDATAFFTKNKRTLCVSHPKHKAWVRGHIEYLKDKKLKSQ
ncbi:C-C motif chemokine 20-like [Plectropomus leopardus]|uniref:C-C motif chemokine 20-like n=1 Tax=Plectropomus leopardus TaxID=160734 RepID=UPI001C4B583D|nr:C-C motif chemokine 20-like [Plectropomus leopardus]